MGPPLEIAIERRGDTTVVSPVGEVDLESSSQLHEALAEVVDEGPAQVVVDLRAVSYLDSTGLGLLLRHDRRAGEAEVEFLVVKGAPQVHRVFEITGVAKLLHMVDEPPP